MPNRGQWRRRWWWRRRRLNYGDRRGRWRRRRRRRRRRCDAKSIQHTDGEHIDVAFVADGIIDPISLRLGTHAPRWGQCVLKTKTVLVVPAMLAALGIRDDDRAVAYEVVFDIQVVVPNAAECPELLRERQHDDGVEI